MAIKHLLFISLMFGVAFSANPTLPEGFPPSFQTSVSVAVNNGTTLLFSRVEIIQVNAGTKEACRWNQRNPHDPGETKPVDYCNYTSGLHFHLTDGDNSGTCAMSFASKGTPQIIFPPEVIANALYTGTQKFPGDIICDVFFAPAVTVNETLQNVQIMIVQGTNNPYYISIVDSASGIEASWTFSDFSTTPSNPPHACIIPPALCKAQVYVCKIKATVNATQLQAGLDWVCSKGGIDCGPINQGGSHYYPNTLTAHCNWAFNTYYQANKKTQGDAACSFGNIARLVPPLADHSITIGRQQEQLTGNLFLPLELTCPWATT